MFASIAYQSPIDGCESASKGIFQFDKGRKCETVELCAHHQGLDCNKECYYCRQTHIVESNEIVRRRIQGHDDNWDRYTFLVGNTLFSNLWFLWQISGRKQKPKTFMLVISTRYFRLKVKQTRCKRIVCKFEGH